MPAWRDLPDANARVSLERLGKAITIRPLASGDGPLLTRFYASLRDRDMFFFFPHPLNPEHAQRLADTADGDGHLTLVATEEREGRECLAGYAYFRQYSPNRPWHFGICVRPDRQSIGLGRELLGRLIRLARALGIPRIELTVHKDNERALRLYKAHGFVLVGEIADPAHGAPEYRMEVALD